MTSTPPRVSRRALAGPLAGLLAAPLLIRAQAPAPPAPGSSPALSGQFQNAGRQLAAFKIARNVEPAFRFEA